MKKLLLYFILAITPVSYYSQCCPYIDSVVVIPEYPNTAEETKVVLTVTTPNQGAFLSAMTEIETNNVMINACYYSGFLTALQTYVDTVNLGFLEEGEYNLEFTATQSDNPEFCNFNDSETVLDSFIVGVLDDINELDKVDLNLYPNPNSSGKVLFDSDYNIVEVEIYNAQGKLIDKISADNNLTIQELDLNYLPKEVYYLFIVLDNGERIMKELIRQ